MHQRRKKRHDLVLPLPPKSLPPKNEKPRTAKKISPYCIAAEKIPPYFGFTASANVVTAKNAKTDNRLKITAVWQYRPACVRLKNRYRLPPRNFICKTEKKKTAESTYYSVGRQFDANRRGKERAEVFSRYKFKARTVVGRVEKILLVCASRSELWLFIGGREKRSAKIINGMQKNRWV